MKQYFILIFLAMLSNCASGPRAVQRSSVSNVIQDNTLYSLSNMTKLSLSLTYDPKVFATLRIAITNSDGTAASGITPVWKVPTELGRISKITASDKNGIATAIFTPKKTATAKVQVSIDKQKDEVAFQITTIAATPTRLEAKSPLEKPMPTRGPVSLEVYVKDAFGNPNSGVEVVWASIPQGLFTSQRSQTNAEGIASSTFSLPSPLTTVTAFASSRALPGKSLTFTIRANANTVTSQLAFVTQPRNSLVGAPIPVVVNIIGPDGKVDTKATDKIILSMDTNPTGAQAFGFETQAIQGTATFSSFIINRLGEGFTIRATSPTQSLTPISSHSFNLSGVLEIKGPNKQSLTACSLFQVSLLDAKGNAMPAPFNIDLTLTTSGSGTFTTTTSNCDTTTLGTNEGLLTINNGNQSIPFLMPPFNAEQHLTAKSDHPLMTSQIFNIVASTSQTHGALDQNFGNAGMLSLSDQGNTIAYYTAAYQADGKMLLGGTTQFDADVPLILARLTPQGQFDTAFGENGIARFPGSRRDVAYALAVSPDGSIAAGGASYSGSNNRERDAMLVRFTKTGAIDRSFGKNGGFTTRLSSRDSNIQELILTPSGTYIALMISDIAGDNGSIVSNYALVKYAYDGTSLNWSTNQNLALHLPNNGEIPGLMALPDGKFLVFNATSAKGLITIERYNIDGSLDTTFASTSQGKATTSSHTSDNIQPLSARVARQLNGRLVIAGYNASNIVLTAMTPEGFIDNTFGTNGIMQIAIPSNDTGMLAEVLTARADGKLLLGGYFDNAGSPPLACRILAIAADGKSSEPFASRTNCLDSTRHGEMRRIFSQPDGGTILFGVKDSSLFFLQRNLP